MVSLSLSLTKFCVVKKLNCAFLAQFCFASFCHPFAYWMVILRAKRENQIIKAFLIAYCFAHVLAIFWQCTIIFIA
jgi:hypothetical protein